MELENDKNSEKSEKKEGMDIEMDIDMDDENGFNGDDNEAEDA